MGLREDHHLRVPIKKCGAGPDYAPWFGLPMEERSRENADKIIYELFFKNKQTFNGSGTYVELGAFNGVKESNSRFFDDCLGWKGLLLEGNPMIYQRTIENRPFAHKMSFAPSCSASYEAVNKTVPFHRVLWTNGGMAGLAEAYDNGSSKNIVEVPCGPLSPVLEDIFSDNHRGNTQFLPTLDFFSLDVEGAEFLVLSTIDFQAIRIHVLMIEVSNSFCKDDDCRVRKQVRAKMASEAYKRYTGLIDFSDLYVHPESPFQ